MSSSTPAAAAASATLWVAPSGFHGWAWAGSLENRYASSASSASTAASAVRISLSSAAMSAQVSGSMASHRSWCVLVSLRTRWAAADNVVEGDVDQALVQVDVTDLQAA